MGAIEDYIADLSQPRRARGDAVHRLVMQLFPGANASMRHRMPIYDLGDNFFAWGNQKSYLSVYTCSAVRLEEFKPGHPDVPSGVGCLNFRDKDAFPLTDLETVIRNALSPSRQILDREGRPEPTTASRRKPVSG